MRLLKGALAFVAIVFCGTIITFIRSFGKRVEKNTSAVNGFGAFFVRMPLSTLNIILPSL